MIFCAKSSLRVLLMKPGFVTSRGQSSMDSGVENVFYGRVGLGRRVRIIPRDNPCGGLPPAARTSLPPAVAIAAS